jgi:hypothetical protein
MCDEDNKVPEEKPDELPEKVTTPEEDVPTTAIPRDRPPELF